MKRPVLVICTKKRSTMCRNSLISARLPCRDSRCGTPRTEGHLSPPPPPANGVRPTEIVHFYVQATILYLTNPSKNTTRTSANQNPQESEWRTLSVLWSHLHPCGAATELDPKRRPTNGAGVLFLSSFRPPIRRPNEASYLPSTFAFGSGRATVTAVSVAPDRVGWRARRDGLYLVPTR